MKQVSAMYFPTLSMNKGNLEEGSDDLKLYFEEVKRKTNLNYKTIPDRFMQFYETLG